MGELTVFLIPLAGFGGREAARKERRGKSRGEKGRGRGGEGGMKS